ncbi:T9SS type A sorting domain-containing protein [Marixanthomonas ophiurae]|uniref:T9SS C-terminal target domain-containing protein n=1 Tax=Marixanthomonas ophiurae TaxID=387659 RepID=A0A3E1Q9N6_9FLAO|nr:T9SS type A sorting domain-containing protein [Marixanthomonas ophiurae]RFN58847.1 T9SS C-terminal target domain-containing protein [Marixanthomonas ophiurae]
MKTSINLKLLLGFIFIFNLQTVITNKQSSTLYAQDPDLFEHTWYFITGELEGEMFFQPPEEHNIEVNFSNDEIFLCYPSCDECYSNYVKITADSFTVSELESWIVLIGDCIPPQNDFIGVHNSVYFYNHENSKNPFTYTIEPVDDYQQLTITNVEGDWAVYNSVLLSTPNFNDTRFSIYPNPVKETLKISNDLNQTVTATIYDVSGKRLQSHALENSLSSIDVKALSAGLYFVFFENKAGERASKKFIKK